MYLIRSYTRRYIFTISTRKYATNVNIESRKFAEKATEPVNFETVFSFPFVQKISLFNRLKVYQMIGTAIITPSCGLFEVLNVVPSHTSLMAAFIGVTGTALFSLASLPMKNIIGFIYISEDNKHIKISSVDYWGRRKNRIIDVDDWIPLLEIPCNNTDMLYLTPQLSDGTKYKLFVKFGIVLNSTRMSVLE